MNSDDSNRVSIEDGTVEERYVAFCDVLGFSSAVTADFNAASKVYVDFINQVRMLGTFGKAQITVYSDSILISARELMPVLSTTQFLWWGALLNDWLIRGGIAHGRVWELQQERDLFVVSEPLVKAAQIEQKVRVPAVQISPDISIPEEYWIHRLAEGPFQSPLIHFNGMNIVNPFNRYWFRSARQRVVQLLDVYPQHSEKYYWFLALAQSVENGEPLIPGDVLTSLRERGVIEFVPNSAEQPSAT